MSSLLAGAVAGAVEGAVTYPTELIKTKLQLQGSAQYTQQGGHQYRGALDCLRSTLKTQGIPGLYRGLTPMLTGNAAKAGVRFLTYDSIKARLRDSSGNLTMGRMMLAGLCAGIVEGGLVVAPAEAVKTRLIHDQCMPRQRFGGTADCVRDIFGRGSGVRTLYRGVASVMARQGANSCVRFAAYDSLKQALVARTGRAVSGPEAFALGMCAGIITVYATMPLDVVKTRMQAGAAAEYRGSLHCFASVVGSEGPAALWKGATPRLARLMFSGAIVFAVYEEVMKMMR
ncbi:hypothetical protein LPJ66_001565 [Kickxella alabastrina]|uniref:Uncharacterized protein n=1 Tax=Kickxella alabastrina TaxID=61397 RepID=A0ACC1ISX1_9FUNG|nr:hypothetical protein LPJ66_001565 [Kickxella alabastrina]